MDINTTDALLTGGGSLGVLGIYSFLKDLFKKDMEEKQGSITKTYEERLDKAIKTNEDHVKSTVDVLSEFVKMTNENTHKLVQAHVTSIIESNKMFISEFAKMNDEKYARYKSDTEAMVKRFIDNQEELMVIHEKKLDGLQSMIFNWKQNGHGNS
jgi:hypothetical protein